MSAGARIHAPTRIIFASFCKSLQILNFFLTFTMKIAIDEQNRIRQGKLSTACHRQNLGHLTAYFGHIRKSRVVDVFFCESLPNR